MDLSHQQVNCLNAMGIELLQSRTKPAAMSEADKAIEQPPLLVAQLELALDYCQQQSKKALELTWQVKQQLEQVELVEQQLLLPNLAQVFASAQLKRQLWQLIHQASH